MNVAYIPLRGGSKSIPMKNIKTMAGMPLAYWVVKAACDCSDIDTVYVSTDSEIISDIVKDFGFDKLRVIGRSGSSATDHASSEIGLLEFAAEYMFDNIVMIQATSPLLEAADLSKGFASLIDADSVLSVVKQKRFIWQNDESGYAIAVNYDFKNRPRRQEFEGYYVENGAFYITRRSSLIESQCRLSGKIRMVEMPNESYIELDEPEDWRIVESLLKRRMVSATGLKIKMFLTDCDGTLTDGGMYYSSTDGVTGETLKKFNTRDGAGLRMLKEAGIITGIITGENSEIARKRAEKLGVDEIFIGVVDKNKIVNDLCVKYGVRMAETAYIGDDINDIEVIKSVGLGFCPYDAVESVKTVADCITKASGGHGAVREAADMVRTGYM